jgi:hypothetical protein
METKQESVERVALAAPIHKSELVAPAALDDRLADWSAMAQGAFATNTLRAWRADWEIFGEFCWELRLEALPATPKTVRDFVFDCLSRGKKPATVRRYVSTIGRAHRASGVWIRRRLKR